MTGTLEWLLDLEGIRLALDAPVSLQWDHALPAWMIAGLVIVIVAVVATVYRRASRSLIPCTLLVLARSVLIALVIVALCGPKLVLERVHVERSYVALLTDISRSMGLRDVYPEALADRWAKAISHDGEEGTFDPTVYSRLDLVKTALVQPVRSKSPSGSPQNPITELLQHQDVELRTFSQTAKTNGWATNAEEFSDLAQNLENLEPTGLATDLPSAIQDTLNQARGRRLSAIVLATDGRSTTSSDLLTALESAKSRLIPIYPIRVGSSLPPQDVRISRLLVPSVVYHNDFISVRARITASAIPMETSVLIHLVEEGFERIRENFERIDDGSGQGMVQRVASKVVSLAAGSSETTVEFSIRAKVPGPGSYRLEIAPLETAPLNRELDTANNSKRFEVLVLDAPLRVLYVEGYPRYEYRYLKNALLREKSMEVSILLLEADDQFVQEGSERIRRFPETLEELRRYDVVLFGDVDPHGGWLSSRQLEILADYVGGQGGSFGVIAGERSAPHRFINTPLEQLLPIQIDPTFQGRYDRTLIDGFPLVLTSEGRHHSLFGSLYGLAYAGDGDASMSIHGEPIQTETPTPPINSPTISQVSPTNPVLKEDAIGSFMESLPEIYWLARSLGPTPGSTVLAVHPTMEYDAPLKYGTPSRYNTSSGSEQNMPLLVSGRLGAGRIFFQASDDFWRWRRHRIDGFPAGETLLDSYWIQVVRMLAEPERIAHGRTLTIRTDRSTYSLGEAVSVTVEIHDPHYLSPSDDVLEMHLIGDTPSRKITEQNSETGQNSATQGAMGRSVISQFWGKRITPNTGRFEATFVPPRPGRFTVTLSRTNAEFADAAGSNKSDKSNEPNESFTSLPFSVHPPGGELRDPTADHTLLERVAHTTGGRVIEPDQILQESGNIPDRGRRIPNDIVEPLWDSKLLLILFAVTITMEWILRKGLGLS